MLFPTFLRKNLRSSNKGLIDRIYFIFRAFFAKKFGLYPFPISNELGAVKSVLISGNWNTTYSLNTKVTETEESFEKFLDVKNCILVPSGGVGIEILMRILKSTNNATCHHIRHVCPASPLSILRGGVAPLPTNPTNNPFNLPYKVYTSSSTDKLVMATHFWGYPEDIRTHPKEHLIEDCCLSFDSYFPDGRHVGTIGKAGVFSFGCLKPIQAGEGGLICTNDNSLAKEIKIMQNYANEIKITGSKDIQNFGLNGRISCLTSAIIYEQLKNYKKYVAKVRIGVLKILMAIEKRKLPVKILIPEEQNISNLGFSSILLEVNPKIYYPFLKELQKNGIETIPPFFEDLYSLTYFKKNIIDDLNNFQQKIYISHYQKSIKDNYVYPTKYISISRRWISSVFMRSIFINALTKSLDTVYK